MATEAQSPVDQLLAAARPAPRAIFTYKVPPGVDPEVTSIGLVQLTVRENELAMTRAANDGTKILTEEAREALREVNGLPVSQGDASLDRAWAAMTPKLRNLVTIATKRLHYANDTESADIFGSQSQTVK